ncbi:MAG: hypothetical protein PUP93_26975 [Rhizonema sp. NSF051]|nr:hypothetical protein [Rhizonema sp. NSF051]
MLQIYGERRGAGCWGFVGNDEVAFGEIRGISERILKGDRFCGLGEVAVLVGAMVVGDLY